MNGTASNLLLRPVRHVLRLVLEAVTPISLASGEAAADRDVSLFRDWNGLPCLAGTSLTGVLRALHADHQSYFGASTTDELFGHEQHRGIDGLASRLMVSFGLAVDSKGEVVEAFRAPADIAADEVLRLLAADTPLLRDHVAITSQGVAREHQKYDRTACPVGTRFSVDLYLDGEADAPSIIADGEKLRALARLFAVPYARFGGSGRRGLGRLTIASGPEGPMAFHAAINRVGTAGRTAWVAFRQAARHRTNVAGFRRLSAAELTAPPASSSKRRPVEATLTLRPTGYWRMGNGSSPWLPSTEGAMPDVYPLTEPVIRWTGSRARIMQQAMSPMPGSGVKGAIAHRAEFHLRRLRNHYTDSGSDPGRLSDDVFGRVRDTDGGFAGLLMIDDAVLDYSKRQNATGHRTRNSIDRHTGGVRLQKLFMDEALWKGPDITLSLVLLTLRSELSIAEDAVTALDWAVDDLRSGRLALGARGSVGDGVMEGQALVCRFAGRNFPSFREALIAARQDIPGAPS